jgi:hypothetical protein
MISPLCIQFIHDDIIIQEVTSLLKNFSIFELDKQYFMSWEFITQFRVMAARIEKYLPLQNSGVYFTVKNFQVFDHATV